MSKFSTRLTIVGACMAVTAGLMASMAGAAAANGAGPFTFEQSQGYVEGDIHGQQGWSNAGHFDAKVVAVGTGQALKISNNVATGAFNQTLSPAVSPAGKNTGLTHFDASFTIAAQNTPQTDLKISVSPDNGAWFADELPPLRGQARGRGCVLRRRHQSRPRRDERVELA